MMKTIQGYTYRISENIGKGYSSTVHRGIKDQTGEDVAIKVIQMVKLEDPINQMLLQHQITALKHLSSSSHVLHLFDVYATKNNTYIITELCEGDLHSMLKSRRVIPYHEAVEILKQIVQAYFDVHNSGYLHRDIKPANVFHRNGAYKLGDFGFAIPRSQLNKHKDYNVGSPVYMPPQALKDNLYSVSCDTWAIGIIFYQMIRGVVPWRAISEQALHKKIITQPLDQLTIGLPEVARVFLNKVLSLDANKRMSIQEMQTWPSKLLNLQPSNKTELPLRQIQITGNINLPHKVMTPKQSSNPAIRYPGPAPTMKGHKYHSDSENIHFFSKPSEQSHSNSKNRVTITHNTNQNVIRKQATLPSNFQPVSPQPRIFEGDGSTYIVKNMEDTNQLATNMKNYLKFIHKTLKFIGAPTKIYLEDLEQALKSSLRQQITIFSDYIANPDSCSLNNWEEFLTSQKGKQFIHQFKKLESKYCMFHIPKDQGVSLGQQLLKAGIFALLQNLESSQNYDQKSVIAADYLITLYQLWDIKNKYSLKQFLKMSKLDLILKGNPYKVSKGSLQQLRKKVSLIDLFN